jgi:hypothetical protein
VDGGERSRRFYVLVQRFRSSNVGLHRGASSTTLPGSGRRKGLVRTFERLELHPNRYVSPGRPHAPVVRLEFWESGQRARGPATTSMGAIEMRVGGTPPLLNRVGRLLQAPPGTVRLANRPEITSGRLRILRAPASGNSRVGKQAHSLR